MSDTLAGWSAALLAFLAFLPAVCVAIRLAGGERHLVEACVGTALMLFAVTVYLLPRTSEAFWGFAALYGFLFIVFLQAFAVISKSISLRMLVEIHERPAELQKVERVHELLVVEGAYARRLNGLEVAGLVSREGQAVRLTAKGRRFGDRLRGAQSVFGVRRSG